MSGNRRAKTDTKRLESAKTLATKAIEEAQRVGASSISFDPYVYDLLRGATTEPKVECRAVGKSFTAFADGSDPNRSEFVGEIFVALVRN